jgi:hypothetical protein
MPAVAPMTLARKGIDGVHDIDRHGENDGGS